MRAGLEYRLSSFELKRQAGSAPRGEMVPLAGRNPRDLRLTKAALYPFSLPFQLQGRASISAAASRFGHSIMRAFHKLACVSCIAISACTTPTPQIVTKYVNVPIPVACIDRSAIPAEPASVALPMDARLAADIAAAQALAYKAYGRELLSLIQPCTRG